MKIIIIFNRDASSDAEAVDTVKTAGAVAKNLATLGHKTELFELKTASLPKFSADVLFNLAWGIGSDTESEDKVADLLEKTGVPYTGPTSKAIRLTGDKVATKRLLQKKGVPTPKFRLIDSLAFPVIVKPSQEDCSIGISQGSIYNEPIFVEEYIEGRELNVTVLGQEALPISEIVFGPVFKDRYKIVDYAAKWETESQFYKQTVGVCPAKLSPTVTEKIKSLALSVFKITGCRDFARVDFRLTADGTPYVLEVNVNPAIGPDDGAVRSTAAAGLSYPKFLEKIVKLAYEHRHEAAGP